MQIAFSQSIGANEPLRTGTYSKTLTFTLSTTSPRAAPAGKTRRAPLHLYAATGWARSGAGATRPLGRRSRTSTAPANATAAAAVRPMPRACVNACPAVSASC